MSEKTTLEREPARARLLLIIGTDGIQTFATDDPDLTIYIIDENCPRDRVFQPHASIERATPERIDEIMGDSRIGQPGDMPGAEEALRRHLSGEPPPSRRAHLSIVGPEEAP